MSAPRLRVVEGEAADGIVEGRQWPLVPDGQYLAVYVGHDVVEMQQFKRQAKVFIHLRLIDAGEYTGRVLFRAYRVRRIVGRRFIVGPRSDLLMMVCRILDHRARPDRISLQGLRHILVVVRTRTICTDRRQRQLPTTMHYSVVDEILGKETTA